jgi:hypothetical protein
MKLDLDFSKITTIEFGLGTDSTKGSIFQLVPVDDDVQDALQDMIAETIDAMEESGDDPRRYEPSEKYSSLEHINLPLDDPMAEQIRLIHEANNLSTNLASLNEPEAIFCYFARMTDDKKRRVTAIRRATQFKGVLKSRLVRLTTDALKLVDDDVFKLDTNFDLLVDSRQVHILRPSSFEFIADLREAVLAAAPANIDAIRGEIDFVDFENVQEYAVKHPRAARYLASIQSSDAAKNIDKSSLKKLLKTMGIEVHEHNGLLTVNDDIMGFLEALDRRRYEIELVKNKPERFRASSRRKL